MTMLVDLSELSCTLDELVDGLQAHRRRDQHGGEAPPRQRPAERKRVAVLVTKEPHCLEQLVRDRDAGLLNGDLAVVLSNHDDLEPIARDAGIPFAWSAVGRQGRALRLPARAARRGEARPRRPRALHADPDAEGDRPLSLPHHQHPPLAAAVPPRSNAYKQAWEEGVRVSGCTAHFVTEQLDAGPVILQDVFHIRVGEDTLDEVKARGQALEGKVLSQAVQLFLNDQLVVKDKKVIFRPGRFPGRGGGRMTRGLHGAGDGARRAPDVERVALEIDGRLRGRGLPQRADRFAHARRRRPARGGRRHVRAGRARTPRRRHRPGAARRRRGRRATARATRSGGSSRSTCRRRGAPAAATSLRCAPRWRWCCPSTAPATGADRVLRTIELLGFLEPRASTPISGRGARGHQAAEGVRVS